MATSFATDLRQAGVPEHIVTALSGEVTAYFSAAKHGYAVEPGQAAGKACQRAYGPVPLQVLLPVQKVVKGYMERGPREYR